MNVRHYRSLAGLLVLATAIALPGALALATSGQPVARVAGPATANTYSLGWSEVGGGGYMFATGGSYSLGGTAGQPGAGEASAVSSYSLAGGFWAIGNGSPASVYLPLVLVKS